MIYLDYSANTPADEKVIESFVNTEKSFTANPNSNHISGKKAAGKMAETIDKTAKLLNIAPSQIIYTSGASESNNTAIKGIARMSRKRGKHIISTPLEHSSVSGCLTYLQETGYDIDLLSIGRDGRIDTEELKSLLRSDTVLVCVTAVDSELGTIQPISEISEILKDFPDCRFHCDATQAIGKIPFDFSLCDTASFAPHKFYGLNGCGVLIKKNNVTFEPLIHGGSSTTPYRSGTPALSLAVSTLTALEIAFKEKEERYKKVKGLNDDLREFFKSYSEVRINSPKDCVPHILNISVNNIKATLFQQMLSERGVCVSVKSACSADGMPSRAVYAVSRDRKNALSSFRISLSHLTTQEEIYDFKEIFDDLIRKNLRCYK